MTGQPLPTIAGVVELDFAASTHSARRHQAAGLMEAELGTRVVVRVRRVRPWDEPDVVWFIAEAATSRALDIEIFAVDVRLLAEWLTALHQHVVDMVTYDGGAP